jgi:hypothetical protein
VGNRKDGKMSENAQKKFTTRVDTFLGKVIMERDGKYLASYPLEHKLEADKIASVMNERGIDVC